MNWDKIDTKDLDLDPSPRVALACHMRTPASRHRRPLSSTECRAAIGHDDGAAAPRSVERDPLNCWEARSYGGRRWATARRGQVFRRRAQVSTAVQKSTTRRCKNVPPGDVSLSLSTARAAAASRFCTGRRPLSDRLAIYDDVIGICRGMRQSVVKALTSALGQKPPWARQDSLPTKPC